MCHGIREHPYLHALFPVGVCRKDGRKIIDKHGEESGSKDRALRHTSVWETKGRTRISNTSDMGAIGEVRFEPRNSGWRKTKMRKLRQKKLMTYSIEGFGNVKKYYSYILLVIKSLVPLIETVKKKSLGGVTRTEARLVWK